MRQQPHKDTPHPRQETKRVAQNTAMITGMTVMKKTAVQKSVHTSRGDFLYTKPAKEPPKHRNPMKTLLIVTIIAPLDMRNSRPFFTTYPTCLSVRVRNHHHTDKKPSDHDHHIKHLMWHSQIILTQHVPHGNQPQQHLHNAVDPHQPPWRTRNGSIDQHKVGE